MRSAAPCTEYRMPNPELTFSWRHKGTVLGRLVAAGLSNPIASRDPAKGRIDRVLFEHSLADMAAVSHNPLLIWLYCTDSGRRRSRAAASRRQGRCQGKCERDQCDVRPQNPGQSLHPRSTCRLRTASSWTLSLFPNSTVEPLQRSSDSSIASQRERPVNLPLDIRDILALQKNSSGLLT